MRRIMSHPSRLGQESNNTSHDQIMDKYQILTVWCHHPHWWVLVKLWKRFREENSHFLPDLVVMIGLQFCRSLVPAFRNTPAPPHLISPLSSLAVKCKLQSRCVSARGVSICVIPRTNYDLSQCAALLATASLTVKMKVGHFLQF